MGDVALVVVADVARGTAPVLMSLRDNKATAFSWDNKATAFSSGNKAAAPL